MLSGARSNAPDRQASIGDYPRIARMTALTAVLSAERRKTAVSFSIS